MTGRGYRHMWSCVPSSPFRSQRALEVITRFLCFIYFFTRPKYMYGTTPSEVSIPNQVHVLQMGGGGGGGV